MHVTFSIWKQQINNNKQTNNPTTKSWNEINSTTFLFSEFSSVIWACIFFQSKYTIDQLQQLNVS